MGNTINNLTTCLHDEQERCKMIEDINQAFRLGSPFGLKCCINRVHTKIAQGELFWCECTNFTPKHLKCIAAVKAMLPSHIPQQQTFVSQISITCLAQTQVSVDAELLQHLPHWVKIPMELLVATSKTH
jgi:hypothetical protein